MLTKQRPDWIITKLKDVCEKVTVGHVGPMVDEYLNDGIPLLRSQNIQPFSLNLSNLKFISPEFHNKLKKSALFPGDVAVVRTGYPGTACVIPSLYSELNCADLVIIRPSKQLDPYYLTCLFNSSWGRGTVAGNLVGVAQQHFNVTVAKEMVIPLPPLETQRKIAAILSAYDDLIENNTRRIKILEEMARMIYREWFVNFRFPGNEKVKMVDSPLGMIPEGWEVVKFTDAVEVLSGGTPKTTVEEYWGGSIPFFAPKDAPTQFYVTKTDKAITELGLKKCNSKLYPKETVFITARGTVGKVVMPASDMAMNQSCYALAGQEGVSQLFVFLLTLQCVDYLKKNTGGATFDTIVVDTFSRLDIIRPPKDIIESMTQRIRPIFELILNLIQKNQNLRQTRDLLLPKLISGEVEV